MHTITLLRHAKSSWGDPSLTDAERPLNARGRKAAPLMAQHMASLGLAPDLVLCSTAARTRETLALVMEHWPHPELTVTFTDALYLAEAEEMLALIRQLPRNVAHVMLVGHNPGMQNLALRLIGDQEHPDTVRIAAKLPTAALLVLETPETSWRVLKEGSARIIHYATPKDLAP